MSEHGKKESLFTTDEIAIIDGKIHQTLNKFKDTSLMGETGLCSLQHEIIASRIEKVVRSAASEQNKRILVGILVIVATQILLHYLIK